MDSAMQVATNKIFGDGNCWLGVRSTATEWIAVALLGQERSPQPSRKKHNSGFGLPPTAVTKI